jgi:hypothetical protein
MDSILPHERNPRNLPSTAAASAIEGFDTKKVLEESNLNGSASLEELKGLYSMINGSEEAIG